MKVKHIIAIFLLGVFITTIGALFKIQHWPYGSELITSGSLTEGLALLLGIWKLFTTKQFKDFLNS
ncbi:GldL-related protein [Kordia zhangzhouensis]|uniref:GldL-related protein n=1 Tax=Kordia zhangzhouensis TaxID=1620405 RepID=UPI0006296669|nr:gliding motility protein GldL [Kordia zhangzhouensis]